MLRLDFASFKYPPSPKVLKVLKQELQTVNEYPEETYTNLKNALAKRYAFTPDSFLIGNGLDEVIDLISRTFLEKGKEAIIPSPTFSQFEKAALRVGAKPRRVSCLKENQYVVNSDDVLANVNKKTGLIWICSPNNPTGGSVSRKTISTILSKTRVPVVVDEALADFSDWSATPLIRKYPNLVVLRTFSKGYCLAGLRVGFAMGTPDLLRRIAAYKQIFNVNRLAVKAALAALEDQGYYDRLWKEFKKERSKQIYLLRELGVNVIGEESNFLLLDFKTRERSEQVYQALLKKKIKIFPGWDEEFTGLPGRYCRVVVGTPKENKTFYTVLTVIMEGLE